MSREATGLTLGGGDGPTEVAMLRVDPLRNEGARGGGCDASSAQVRRDGVGGCAPDAHPSTFDDGSAAETTAACENGAREGGGGGSESEIGRTGDDVAPPADGDECASDASSGDDASADAALGGPAAHGSGRFSETAESAVAEIDGGGVQKEDESPAAAEGGAGGMSGPAAGEGSGQDEAPSSASDTDPVRLTALTRLRSLVAEERVEEVLARHAILRKGAASRKRDRDDVGFGMDERASVSGPHVRTETAALVASAGFSLTENALIVDGASSDFSNRPSHTGTSVAAVGGLGSIVPNERAGEHSRAVAEGEQEELNESDVSGEIRGECQAVVGDRRGTEALGKAPASESQDAKAATSRMEDDEVMQRESPHFCAATVALAAAVEAAAGYSWKDEDPLVDDDPSDVGNKHNDTNSPVAAFGRLGSIAPNERGEEYYRASAGEGERKDLTRSDRSGEGRNECQVADGAHRGEAALEMVPAMGSHDANAETPRREANDDAMWCEAHQRPWWATPTQRDGRGEEEGGEEVAGGSELEEERGPAIGERKRGSRESSAGSSPRRGANRPRPEVIVVDDSTDDDGGEGGEGGEDSNFDALDYARKPREALQRAPSKNRRRRRARKGRSSRAAAPNNDGGNGEFGGEDEEDRAAAPDDGSDVRSEDDDFDDVAYSIESRRARKRHPPAPLGDEGEERLAVSRIEARAAKRKREALQLGLDPVLADAAPTPVAHDFLLWRGRDGRCRHAGNELFTTLVAASAPLGEHIPAFHWVEIARSVVRAVRALEPRGRFLQRDDGVVAAAEGWREVGGEAATMDWVLLALHAEGRIGGGKHPLGGCKKGAESVPNEHDVLISEEHNWEENTRFRCLISAYRQLFVMLPRKEEVATAVVHVFRSLYPSGRFLQRGGEAAVWREIGDPCAVKFTFKALNTGVAPRREIRVDERQTQRGYGRAPRVVALPPPEAVRAAATNAESVPAPAALAPVVAALPEPGLPPAHPALALAHPAIAATGAMPLVEHAARLAAARTYTSYLDAAAVAPLRPPHWQYAMATPAAVLPRHHPPQLHAPNLPGTLLFSQLQGLAALRSQAAMLHLGALDPRAAVPWYLGQGAPLVPQTRRQQQQHFVGASAMGGSLPGSSQLQGLMALRSQAAMLHLGARDPGAAVPLYLGQMEGAPQTRWQQQQHFVGASAMGGSLPGFESVGGHSTGLDVAAAAAVTTTTAEAPVEVRAFETAPLPAAAPTVRRPPIEEPQEVAARAGVAERAPPAVVAQTAEGSSVERPRETAAAGTLTAGPSSDDEDAKLLALACARAECDDEEFLDNDAAVAAATHPTAASKGSGISTVRGGPLPFENEGSDSREEGGECHAQGRWATNENILYTEAMAMFGKGRWKMVAKHVGTRTPTQCKTYHQKFVLRSRRQPTHDVCVKETEASLASTEEKIGTDGPGNYTSKGFMVAPEESRLRKSNNCLKRHRSGFEPKDHKKRQRLEVEATETIGAEWNGVDSSDESNTESGQQPPPVIAAAIAALEAARKAKGRDGDVYEKQRSDSISTQTDLVNSAAVYREVQLILDFQWADGGRIATNGATPEEREKKRTRKVLSQNCSSAWERKVFKLVEYHSQHGSWFPRIEHDKSLHRFAIRQRTLFGNWEQNKEPCMTENRAIYLKELGVDWSSPSPQREKTWETWFQRLIRFKEVHGHLRVTTKDDTSLYAWITSQRYQYKRGNVGRGKQILTKERVQRLNQLGFHWDRQSICEELDMFQEGTWWKRLKELQQYREKHGDTLVPTDNRLYTWVTLQRHELAVSSRGDSSRLTEERIQHLKDVGISRDSPWEQKYQALKEFKQKHGHIQVRSEEDESLYRWLSRERTFQKGAACGNKVKMSEERLRRLEELGVEWSSSRCSRLEEAWEDRFQELLRFKETYGNCLPQLKEDRVLCKWVSSQRARYKHHFTKKKKKEASERSKGILTSERIERLNSIGFLWVVKKGPKKDSEVPSRNDNNEK